MALGFHSVLLPTSETVGTLKAMTSTSQSSSVVSKWGIVNILRLFSSLNVGAAIACILL